MRHLKKTKKLGRTASHRKAMLANMASSLIKHERIQTTDAKAKALRPFIERLITLGKRGDLHARRLANSRLRDREATQKLFNEIAGRMEERPGGYTRIIKLSRRKGDNAPLSLIELVDVDLARILSLRGASDEEIADMQYDPERYESDDEDEAAEGEEEKAAEA
jgi:large subunit ribosomal protein L17